MSQPDNLTARIRGYLSQPGGFFGRMAGRVLVAHTAEREATRSLQRLKAFLERR